MLYIVQEGKIVYERDGNEGMGDGIAIIKRRDMWKELNGNDPFDQMIARILKNETIRFEAHDQLDVYCLPFSNPNETNDMLYLFLQEHSIWMVSERSEYLDQLMERWMKDNHDTWTMHSVWMKLMEDLLEKEDRYLDQLEKQIWELENSIVRDRSQKGMVNSIMWLRKALIQRNHVYMLCDDAFASGTLHEQRIKQGSDLHATELVGRHYHHLAQRISTLQDYVSELRDAYQAQVGNNLNATMRVFTVITAVFLPLSLIVGWYGMNFNMPEYAYEYGYPIVIGASALITIVLLVYFKVHRWY